MILGKLEILILEIWIPGEVTQIEGTYNYGVHQLIFL